MVSMLSNEILLKRLALIKQLYKIGYEQSYQNESISVFSLLAFHDSIEMFLKLVSEHKNINSSKFSFIDYWTKITNLTLKESMRNLNSRRVNIKHKGLLPAKSEIEISRVNTTDFFEQNTKVQFDIEFKDVSLTELITYKTVKEFLTKSEKALINGNSDDCIENVAYAFDELLHVYSSNKSSWGMSPFFFGKSMSFHSAFLMGLSGNDTPDELKKIGDFIDDVKETIEQLQKVTKITSFGIDYREYLKFKILTPNITRTMESNKVAEIYGSRKWTKENCQYCIDFVIKSALKLQEFNFDISHLEEDRFELDIKE
jgi:hypothetical protein